jgi:hypothetical protein
MLQCSQCGFSFDAAQLVNGLVPPHGSPGPLPGQAGCPGVGRGPRRPIRVERALIGTDANGIPVILATDSEHIAADLACAGTSAEDVGLCGHLAPGLYLWEGISKLSFSSWEAIAPDGTEYQGTLRPVKPEEVAELYAMEPPDQADDLSRAEVQQRLDELGIDVGPAVQKVQAALRKAQRDRSDGN